MSTAKKPLKIVLLGARNSIHTVRWANSLAERGHQILLIASEQDGPPLNPLVRFQKLSYPTPLGYFLNVFRLKKIIRLFQPDLLHAHYASGYGTLADLSGFQPRITSVWGSDIYDFPRKSTLHKWVVGRNLGSSKWICSTSKAMADEAIDLYPNIQHKLSVTPFGIDLSQFTPQKSQSDTFTVGTIKTLSSTYGIDTLINGFAQFQQTYRDQGKKARLLIAGTGPDEEKLKTLVKFLDLADSVSFLGQVKHQDVPSLLSQMDVFVATSRQESFGVAILEASAMMKPVIVTNVGGLPEVVVDNVTGIVIAKDSPDQLAENLLKLASEPRLREKMGQSGRELVEKSFNWDENVSRMESVYDAILNGGGPRG